MLADTFRWKILLKFLLLAHSKGFSVIFMRKKEKMEKSKYWWRNDGFLFETEVKVTLLIDSPMVFFAGVSMRGGWIIRNVFLSVNDSMHLTNNNKMKKDVMNHSSRLSGAIHVYLCQSSQSQPSGDST